MIDDFLLEHFFYLHPGYTIFNTVIFGIVLGVIILGIIRIFKKIGKNPIELTYPLIPIIILGSTSRALVDNHVYPRIHLLATPGIYIFIGLVTIMLLLASIVIEKHYNIRYTKSIFIIGSILCIPNIVLILSLGVNYKIILAELLLWKFVTDLFIPLKKRITLLSTSYNLEILSAHIFDATSTFVAVDFFGYYEQHVLPTFLINLTHTSLIMYPLKIVIILVILFIIDNILEDSTTKNMLKLSVFILGLAPGIRNFTTLILAIS